MPVKKEATIEIVKDSKLTIFFKNPFVFEGETHTSVDLSELENVTASQLAAAESEVNVIMPETSMEYALVVASKVTGKPQSFFLSLPGKEGIKVKRAVLTFLNN